MTLIRKNEILSGMGDKLMNIQNDAVREETKFAIKKIARELQQTTDSEIWNEFETRFKQVHNDFYNSLNRNFPSLTPAEKRLCAFLKINMTTKEISELTGQRIDTLEIARWRLRKKLKITNTKTNLVTYLSEI
jgi:DNA-binding CsgD family transcriptional regulator